MNNKAMHKLSYGLFVLTAQDENGRNTGCIINTAIQAASEPNTITICVNKANYTHDVILKTNKFNISMLSESADFDIFRHLSTSSQTSRTANSPATVCPSSREARTRTSPAGSLRRWTSGATRCSSPSSPTWTSCPTSPPARTPTISSTSNRSPSPLPKPARSPGSARFAGTSTKATPFRRTSSVPCANTPPPILSGSSGKSPRKF